MSESEDLEYFIQQQKAKLAKERQVLDKTSAPTVIKYSLSNANW